MSSQQYKRRLTPDMKDVNTDLQDSDGVISSLKDKWQQILEKVSNFGSNKLTSGAVSQLQVFNDILIFGPPRVGKSTLINVLSGTDQQATSASLDAKTKEITEVKTEIFRYWDTPGIESWDSDTAVNRWNELFVEKKILPLCIICVISAGCYMNTQSEGFQSIVNCSKKYSVPFFYVVTNPARLDDDSDQAIADFICETHSVLTIKPIKPNLRRVKDKVFLSIVNSVPFKNSFLNLHVSCFGISTLRNAILDNQSKTAKINMIKFYKDNATFWEKSGSWLFDAAHFLNFPVEEFLDQDELDIYNQLSKDQDTLRTLLKKAGI